MDISTLKIMDRESVTRIEALRRFEQARRQALLEQMSARLTGRDTRMLPFEAIRSQLRQQNPMYRGVQQIPLDKIVGSVGRYREFTRTFMPLNDELKERWIGVDSLSTSTGWPPITAYQVGDVYFVNDGNHRTSVARQLQMQTIEAHVWQFPDDIHIGPNDSLDDVLIRLGEHGFMDRTNLDKLHPDHNIRLTTPGRYNELLAQIEDLRGKLSQIDNQEMSFAEAVDAWYEMIYLPTVQIIRDSTLLKDFPGRTETDLFVWLSMHRDQLGELYGEYDNLADLAQILADRYREGNIDRIARQFRRLLGDGTLPPLVGLETTIPVEVMPDPVPESV